MLLYAHGDVQNPLPDTVRVFDEILTDFMQSIAFEAARAAHYSGRQKIKYEDFEFSFRKNPAFLGKVQEVFEKQKEIKKARDLIRDGEEEIMKDAVDDEKKKRDTPGTGTGGVGAEAGAGSSSGPTTAEERARKADEELGEADDDDAAEADAIGKKRA